MIKFKNQYNDDFFKAILTLKDIDECYKFCADICTPKEINTISQRYVVAKMLTDGRVYSDIVTETGASTATVSRVNRSLSDGNGGYDIVFERIEK